MLRMSLVAASLIGCALGLPRAAAAPGGELEEEPAYMGRSLRQWIADLKDDDAQVRQQAADTLSRMGPRIRPAFAALKNAVKDNDLRHNAALALGSTGPQALPILLELLESDNADSGTSRWIAEHGEGLFHICLEVEDIDAAMAELRQKGVGFQQEKPVIGHGNCRIVFLDPRSTGNLVIELAEMPKDAHAHGPAAQHAAG